MVYELSENELQEFALEAGFSFLGATEVVNLGPGELQRLQQWQSEGCAGEMQYMLREGDERVNAKTFAEQTTTVLTFAIPYQASRKQPLPLGFGRIARYAVARDYHRTIKKRLERLRKEISDSQQFFWRPITDSFPLLERAFGASSQLGFVGKNTMLIRQKLGSFFFLGEVLTNLTMRRSHALEIYDGGCGSCSNCMNHCPTDAFIEPYRMDARKCISYLTIEKRTPFTEWESKAVGEWLFGCDLCQEVCPFNYSRMKKDSFSVWDEFTASGGEQCEIEPLFDLQTEEEFRAHFQGTSILRTGREGLLRNALSVIANTNAQDVLHAIVDRALTDQSQMVRTEARRTVKRITPGRGH